MKKYRIPNTDLDVSRLAYGTWHLGGSWDGSPLTDDMRERANRLVMTAVEHGINHIDLADIYTRGKSDKCIGHVLKQNPGLREKLVLQTKVGIVLPAVDGSTIAHFDYSYDHLVGAVETVLSRLGTDYVDLLAFHRPDALVEPEEVARAVDHLHASGKVRHFGVSNHNIQQIELLKKFVDRPLVVNQLELNLIHHYMISDGIVGNMQGGSYNASHGLIDYCRLNNMVVQSWSPVGGGKMFTDEKYAELKGVIDKMAEKHSTTSSAIVVAWLLRHPAPIQPILGTLKPERLVETVPADAVELSKMAWYELLAAARGAGVP